MLGKLDIRQGMMPDRSEVYEHGIDDRIDEEIRSSFEGQARAE